MPRLAANLTYLFTELPLFERFRAAAAAGFKGAELLFPYEVPADEIAAAFRGAGLEPVLFNTPAGDWEAGERGLAALPDREAEFAAGMDKAVAYARAIGVKRLHIMAGIPPGGADPAECDAIFVSNIKTAAVMAAPHGITIVIEPINQHNTPGYFLNRQDHAIRLLDAAGARNTALQMDFFHCARVEGDPAAWFRRNRGRIGHIQIAGVPDRHEPDSGELDYAPLFTLIDESGYQGWVSCEYRPRGSTLEGLAWAREWGIGAE